MGFGLLDSRTTHTKAPSISESVVGVRVVKVLRVGLPKVAEDWGATLGSKTGPKLKIH